jgi:hypothetical protein
MNTIQTLLKEIQAIFQNQSLSAIEKDIALEKTRKLYEAILASSTHSIIEQPIAKPLEIKAEPVIEKPKQETVQPIVELVKTTSIKNESNSESLNDVLNKNRKTELADKLEHTPIKDLKASIGFNDKFSFIQNLFAGDNVAYSNTIAQFNSFTNKSEAEQLLNELAIQHKWNEAEEITEHFKELINRKFL